MVRDVVSSLIRGFTVAAVVSLSWAAAAAPVATANVRADLVAEDQAVRPGDTVWLALVLDIRGGWHTYWRNPGDSGEPLVIDWTLPAGVTVGDIQWPYPHRLPVGPLVNFGYEGRAAFLMPLTVPDGWPAGRPIDAVGEATWLVCEEICIPEAATLSLSIATAADRIPNTAAAATFASARAQLPQPAPWPSAFGVTDGHLTLAVETGADRREIRSAFFFPYEWGAVEPAAAQTVARDGDRLTLTMAAGPAPPQTLAGVLVLTTATGVQALDIAATPATAPPVPTSAVPSAGTTAPSLGTAQALLFALLGGLILNLMPCVFPVLSMKALGLVAHATEPPRALRRNGLAYAAGVLCFMAAVAGFLIALRAAGTEIGWGFQLQSPAFVGVMALVLFSLGLGLSGVVDLGVSMAAWGQSLAARQGLVGSFFTGALAALVATPCTAPFMGAALGFALWQPWPTALAVMLALGLGLALPYLLLTWIPGVARRLPRPGAWMARLKEGLAFPMYLSAAWLVWVVSIQAGPAGVILVLAAMILVAFAAWLNGVTRLRADYWRRTGGLAAAAATVAALVLAVSPQTRAPAATDLRAGATAVDTVSYEPFSPGRLAALRSAGTPVFVNMTAAWCITCKVNEQVALSSERVGRALAERGVVALKGDWTNRDPDITRFLGTFGRSGVPLYVLYGSDGTAPTVLPQVLTEALVVAAIEALPPMPHDHASTERR